MYAEQLHARGHDVRVLTTCARNHHTWANELREGVDVIDGITIERCLISITPDLELVPRLHRGVDVLPPPQQEILLRNKGYSQPLFDRIDALRDDVDVFIFGPYLFPTTVFGVQVCPQKSVVMTALHDEAYARFDLVQESLRRAAAIVALTPEEARLIDEVIPGHAPVHVVGAGFEPAAATAARATADSPYIMYAGRLEDGKNFPLLVDWITEYNSLRTGDEPVVRLKAVGQGEYRLPDSAAPYVDVLGYVDEGVRASLMTASLAVANISVNESFSFVLMEAWLAGVPVIVHAGCPVTREHCRRSGGGLWCANSAEFVETVRVLLNEKEIGGKMAKSGRAYVLAEYSWDSVATRLQAALESVTAVAAT
jgi:glycosyltransferase involved in cell wall biosynthesis